MTLYTWKKKSLIFLTQIPNFTFNSSSGGGGGGGLPPSRTRTGSGNVTHGHKSHASFYSLSPSSFAIYLLIYASSS
ncbi:hypothetical protein L6452_19444 [Arctium lappa]|uniref:Uncharacterized protein n=1 Tax=Arctium lappa TaxID=4217 RepID=A0ACB9B7W2_ARCLA|nr:hypothetical protein L6452_19444 [Arctium lappa]